MTNKEYHKEYYIKNREAILEYANMRNRLLKEQDPLYHTKKSREYRKRVKSGEYINEKLSAWLNSKS